MTLFTKNRFQQQAIILLSAQMPKSPHKLEAFKDNFHTLINTFNRYEMGQKIAVLGDYLLIEEALLKNTSWLFAYNSAYEQPMITSLQRGTSLIKDHIESAMIWPLNAQIQPPAIIEHMLMDQKQNLDKVIKSEDQLFPVCIPKNRFRFLLSLPPSQSLHDVVNYNLVFSKP